ncbi:MAG: AraC family transcriptional regulator [Pseudomonadota bacterium]
MAQVRTAALTNYFEVARFVGLDPLRMLKRARINPAMLADPDRWIARNSVNFVLTESAREANCQSFGLMMAESRSLSHMGAISLLLQHQETVRDSIESMARYHYMLGDTVSASLEDKDPLVAVRINIIPGDSTIERQGIELAMGILYRAIVAVSGGKWRAESVHFMHSVPGDLAVHRRVFGCPLVFDASFHGFVCTPASLDLRNAMADPEMARYAASYLDRLAPDAAGAPMEQQVRRSLDLMLPLGRATLEQVAENLGMPARTLQRLLEKEGHSFATLLGGVRRELVLDYLTNSSHSLGEIARMIGYSTPSSFNRWFYSEFGLTPSAWRAGERPPEPDFPGEPAALPPRPKPAPGARPH